MLPFCFLTNLGTVTVGWGLFQNILRSVPERNERWRRCRLLPGWAVALPTRPEPREDSAWSCRGLRGARSWYRGPGWPPGPSRGPSRALSPSPRPESLRGGTEGGNSRGPAPAGPEVAPRLTETETGHTALRRFRVEVGETDADPSSPRPRPLRPASRRRSPAAPFWGHE